MSSFDLKLTVNRKYLTLTTSEMIDNAFNLRLLNKVFKLFFIKFDKNTKEFQPKIYHQMITRSNLQVKW